MSRNQLFNWAVSAHSGPRMIMGIFYLNEVYSEVIDLFKNDMGKTGTI